MGHWPVSPARCCGEFTVSNCSDPRAFTSYALRAGTGLCRQFKQIGRHGGPIVLVENGQLIDRNLRRERLTRDEGLRRPG